MRHSHVKMDFSYQPINKSCRPAFKMWPQSDHFSQPGLGHQDYCSRFLLALCATSLPDQVMPRHCSKPTNDPFSLRCTTASESCLVCPWSFPARLQLLNQLVSLPFLKNAKHAPTSAVCKFFLRGAILSQIPHTHTSLSSGLCPVLTYLTAAWKMTSTPMPNPAGTLYPL